MSHDDYPQKPFLLLLNMCIFISDDGQEYVLSSSNNFCQNKGNCVIVQQIAAIYDSYSCERKEKATTLTLVSCVLVKYRDLRLRK